MSATHEVFNQPAPLADVNLISGNRALQDAIRFNPRAHPPMSPPRSTPP